MKRLVFLAGVGAGYLVGTPSGRRQLAKFKVWATDVWQDPRVQELRPGVRGQGDRVRQAAGRRALGEGRRHGHGRDVGLDHQVRPDDVVVEPLMDADDANPGQR